VAVPPVIAYFTRMPAGAGRSPVVIVNQPRSPSSPAPSLGFCPARALSTNGLSAIEIVWLSLLTP